MMQKSPFILTGLGWVFFLSLGVPAQAQLHQSPIDIRSDNAAFGSLTPLNFTYINDTDLAVINTGSPGEFRTIEALVEEGAGILKFGFEDFELEQFHFHTPSENQLNGQTFAGELHLVHKNENDEFLVVARWIEAGSFNALLDPIFSNLPPLETTSPIPIDNFNLSGLLPSDLSSYRFPGSFTTPPFTEGVQWIVLNDTLELSQGQINNFQALFPNDNARSVQALNGRVVQTDVARVAAVPEPTATLSILALGTLGTTSILKRKLKCTYASLRS